MKRTTIFQMMIAAALLMVWTLAAGPPAAAQETLKYSCSNQVFNAFEMDKLNAFTKETGIQVDVYATSSGSAVYRLMNGYSDVASTARKLYRRHEDYGYSQIAFCTDPIAVITHVDCGVANVTEAQLQDIFSGDITNWKEVGGPNLPILIIVPGTETAANKNFRRLVMKHKEIKFDFMAYESTMAIEAVKHFPCGAISFISQGAAVHHKDIKALKVDGKSPSDKGYPYFQTFYYITKGEPAGHVKAFIDFTFSQKGGEIIKHNGMLPLAK